MKLQIGIDGKTYQLEVEVLEEDHAPRPRGYLPPHAPPMTVRSVAAPAAAPAPAKDAGKEDHAGATVCRSPVAGVVIRVNAQVGQQLQPDDLIMVLEAMKMETNVTAAVAGKVKAINVAEGDAVKANQVLVVFEK